MSDLSPPSAKGTRVPGPLPGTEWLPVGPSALPGVPCGLGGGMVAEGKNSNIWLMWLINNSVLLPGRQREFFFLI